MIADGAHGLWAATTKAYPSAQQQRCWLHKNRNVLDKVPEKQQPRVLEDLRSIVAAPNQSEARSRIERLHNPFNVSIPKRQHAYEMTSIAWSRSFAFRKRAGRVCVRPTRSNRSSPQCDYELTPRDVYEPEPRRRTYFSSSFNACRPAGAGSTAIALSPLKTHRLREIISTPMLRR